MSTVPLELRRGHDHLPQREELAALRGKQRYVTQRIGHRIVQQLGGVVALRRAALQGGEHGIRTVVGQHGDELLAKDLGGRPHQVGVVVTGLVGHLHPLA